VRRIVERTYEISLLVRCKVAADNEAAADAAAQEFAELVAGWVDGSLDGSPFDHAVQVPPATARARDFEWNYGTLTPEEIKRLWEKL
jgi:hypothetical protein